MALALTFEQSNNGKTLTITDASTAGTDMTGAALTITWGGIVYPIDLTGVVPTWTVDSYIELDASSIGGNAGDVFLDGIYVIDYSNDAIGDIDVQYNVLLDYNVKYCVYNIMRQLPDIHAQKDICINDQVNQALFMNTYLKSLEYSAACGQVNEINVILVALQKLCLNPRVDECYCN